MFQLLFHRQYARRNETMPGRGEIRAGRPHEKQRAFAPARSTTKYLSASRCCGCPHLPVDVQRQSWSRLSVDPRAAQNPCRVLPRLSSGICLGEAVPLDAARNAEHLSEPFRRQWLFPRWKNIVSSFGAPNISPCSTSHKGKGQSSTNGSWQNLVVLGLLWFLLSARSS